MTYLTIALPLVLILLVACDSRCPEADDRGLDVKTNVRLDIKAEVTPLLEDPGSYEPQTFRAPRLETTRRSDGSKYYNTLFLSFTAKNRFGDQISGIAGVELEEDDSGQCQVTRAWLRETWLRD